MRSLYGHLQQLECLVLVPTIVGLLRGKSKHVDNKKEHESGASRLLFFVVKLFYANEDLCNISF